MSLEVDDFQLARRPDAEAAGSRRSIRFKRYQPHDRLLRLNLTFDGNRQPIERA